jgi:hypothetical protein
MKPASSLPLTRRLPSAGSLLVGILVGLVVATVSHLLVTRMSNPADNLDP